jgi:hypothetical protein
MQSAGRLFAGVFQVIADEVNQPVRSRRISQADLEQKLDPGGLKFLGKNLAVSSWVPIEVSTRLLQLLFEASGRSDLREYMRERGRTNAQRLKEAGLGSRASAPHPTHRLHRDRGPSPTSDCDSSSSATVSFLIRAFHCRRLVGWASIRAPGCC